MSVSLGIGLLTVTIALLGVDPALAFEGRISVLMTRGTESNNLVYTVGPEQLRIAVTSTNWPHPVNIVDLESGAVTLVFPHNRSFVRLKNVAAGVPPAGDGRIVPPGPARESKTESEKPSALPPGVTPAATTPFVPPPVIGPQPGGAGAVPVMPMPTLPMPDERLELQARTNTMTILGFACVRYEIKQRSQTLEVWATDKLLPYPPYQRNQPSRFGPRMLEEQWPDLLNSRKLFPLRASLRFDNGAERFRFEVKSVRPDKIADTDGKLFQPPTDYHELEPLPF